MNLLLLVLRFIHVITASLWVGFGVFSAMMLGPALRGLGPDAGKVMGALQRRGLATVMPLIALGTIISGFWLYWLVSGGMISSFAQSRAGLTFGIGGIVALAAYLLGITVTRPTMIRVTSVMQGIATAPNVEERTRLAGEAEQLRARADLAGKAGAMMLLLSAASMAVARYL